MILNRRTTSHSEKYPLPVLARLRLIGAALIIAASLSVPGQTSATGQQSKSAPNLAREIHHQLAELPFYSAFDFIIFSLDGKKVTLNGYVLRPSLKKHAQQAIQSLEGVETVNDQIQVLPSSTADNELRRAIYRAIYEDPVLDAYAVQPVPSIHIIVKDRNVTLEGSVESAADMSLAAKRAATVENVVSLKNNLNVRARQDPAQ